MQDTRPIKIGVLGHIGNGNLGDEAIVAAALRSIKERLPEAELIGFALRPADTVQRHGIPTFPIRRGYANTYPWTAAAARTDTGHAHTVRPGGGGCLRKWLCQIPPLYWALRGARRVVLAAPQVVLEVPFLVQSFRRLSSMSLLIIAGSQQLSDIKGGTWWCPFTVFKWTLLARLRRVPVAIVSVGAGPLDSALSRWFTRCTVAMATYRSYRDEISRDCIRALGFAEPGPFTPDLAFGLAPMSPTPGPASPPTVALNPMPAFIWRDYDQQTGRALHTSYANTLAAFTVWLVQRGYRVAFVATQLRGDPPVIDDILGRIRTAHPAVVDEGHAFVHPVGGFDDLLAGLRMAQIVVATRFHGAVLGCAVGRPVLALAYHPKTRALMANMGYPQYAVGAQGIRLDELQAAFLDLERHTDDVSARQQSRLAAVRLALAAQYDRLVELARTGRVGAPEYSAARTKVA